MLTLHQATEEIKIVSKWGGLLVVTVITVSLIFNGGKWLKTLFNPPKALPPTICFGKIPTINFPENVTNQVEAYTLDTDTGELPTFRDRIEVFEIAQPEPNLLALKKAQEKLSNISFKNDPIPVTGTIYQWENDIPPNKKIKYDTLSQNFELTSDYLNDQEVLAANNLPTEKEAIKIAEDYLTFLNSLPKDIDKSKTKTTIFSIRNGKLVPASSLSLSQVIRVDYYQQDINKKHIYYSNYPNSTMSFLVAAGGFTGQIIEANYSYNKVTPNEKECTYPIKTSQQAFEELKKGKGYIATYSGNTSNVSIRNIFPAYYMDNKSPKYIFPIIVFEGNDDFVAFVKAIPETRLTN